MGKTTGKKIRREALDTYMDQGLEVTVNFKNGDEITGFLSDVSEDTFRYVGGCDLPYDDLASVQTKEAAAVKKGKTIKEKAIIAAADDRQVVITTVAEGKYTGWITSTEDDSFAWEHPLGAKQHFQNIAVKDIRFVGEPETKEEEFKIIVNEAIEFVDEPETKEIRSHSQLTSEAIREATVDELGAENEELKRDNELLTNKARIAELEIENTDLLQDQVVEEEREQNDADTINGQSKQIRGHLATIADLEERLTGQPDVKADGNLSCWGWLARIARVRKKRVVLTVGDESISGYFVDVGSSDGRMYGLFDTDGSSERRTIYHDEIKGLAFGKELDESGTKKELEVPLADETGQWVNAAELMKHRHAKDENADLSEKLTVAGGEAQDMIRRLNKYKALNADLTERLTVAEADQEIVMECQAAPESLLEKLEHATQHAYAVTVSGNKSSYTITGKILRIGLYEAHGSRICVNFLSGSCVYLDTIQHVEIAYAQSDSEPDEPEDIAKQRWMIYKGVCGVEIRQRCDGHEPTLALMRRGSLDEHIEFVATDAQIDLMAAAPELADRLREAVEGGSAFEEDMPDVVKHIKFLRELGIPHVATWYKGESEGKADIAPSQLDEIAALLNENADLKKQIAAHDGVISVSGARKRMRDAFAHDSGFKQTYIANIAVMLFDEIGEPAYEDRNEIAEKILDRVFEK